MFSALLRGRTLKSILAAAAFYAGAPRVEAAPKPPVQKSEVSQNMREHLLADYMLLCRQLEDNLPYCYLDKGVVATGAGVHLKDFPELKDLKGIQVTLKKGVSLNLKKLKDLDRLSATNIADMTRLFPEVAKAEKIQLSKCKGPFPSGKTQMWHGPQLIVVPPQVLALINKTAARFCVNKALEIHPNLNELSPLISLIVTDLIYGMGCNGYLNGYPNLQKAIQQKNYEAIIQECTSKNARRDPIRCALADAALTLKKNPKITPPELLRQMKNRIIKQNPQLALEKELLNAVDVVLMRQAMRSSNRFVTRNLSTQKSTVK